MRFTPHPQIRTKQGASPDIYHTTPRRLSQGYTRSLCTASPRTSPASPDVETYPVQLQLLHLLHDAFTATALGSPRHVTDTYSRLQPPTEQTLREARGRSPRHELPRTASPRLRRLPRPRPSILAVEPGDRPPVAPRTPKVSADDSQPASSPDNPSSPEGVPITAPLCQSLEPPARRCLRAWMLGSPGEL